MPYLLAVTEFAGYPETRLRYSKAGLIKQPVSLTDFRPGFGRNAMAPQPHDVYTYYPGRIPVNQGVRRHILGYLGHPSYHRHPADAGELVDPAHPPQNRIVLDNNVTCKRATTGKYGP